jgi:competence protein ComEA
VTDSEPPPDDALAPSARAGARWRIGLGAAVVLLVLGVAVAVVAGLLAPGGGVRPVASRSAATGGGVVTPAATASPSAASVVVHVLGQVKRPGVYELPDGSRVIDAIGAAGGFTAAADQGGVNLARVLVDGEQLLVPKPGEAPAPTAGTGGAGPSAGPGGKIDLNTATLEQLETLPRVGPAMAQRIVDWRTQNGRFASVDDLQNVSGIGEKTFAELRDLVVVR